MAVSGFVTCPNQAYRIKSSSAPSRRSCLYATTKDPKKTKTTKANTKKAPKAENEAPKAVKLAPKAVKLAPKAEKEAPVEVPTLRKADVIASIAGKTGMTKVDSEAALAAVLDTIQEGVTNGNKVALPGFGTFKTTNRAARLGRNPRTGEEIQIAASSSPSFTAAKAFKDKLNQ